MTFFAILIVLAFLQLWGSGSPLQRDSWLKEWSQFLDKKLPTAELKLMLMVAVPMLIVLLLVVLFEGVLFGALSLALYVAVLLYSLGRGEFNESINDYLISWRSGNFEAAYEKASAIGDFQHSENIKDTQSLHGSVRQVILYEGYQRWFAVIFWFLILGPAGALGYRLCYLGGRNVLDSTEDEQAMLQLALRVGHYLDWLPARLLALSFSLTGGFEAAFSTWLSKLKDNLPAPELIDGCATAALNGDVCMFLSSDEDQAVEQGERELNAVQALLSRSVICWLIIIALLQMII